MIGEELEDYEKGGRILPTLAADPVATYDIMRDAATRLGALYAQRIGVGGLADPAVVALQALDAEVMAVAPEDIAAQKAMTEALWARYAELVAGDAEVGL